MRNSTLCLIVATLFVLLIIRERERSPETDNTQKTVQGENVREASAKQQKDKSKQKRTITVKNDIEDSDLRYKHWTGTHTPSTFILSVNGQTIERGEQCKIDIADDMFDVRYDYDFGPRKGAEIISFATNSDHSDFSLAFSWKNENRILIDNASAQYKEKASFKG